MHSAVAVQPNNVSSTRNPNTSSGEGSRTIVISEDAPRQNQRPSGDATLILRARPQAEIQRRQPRVQWQENVVDNEGLGRKKSKVCCIYNKPKAFDESSDESDHTDSDCCSSRPSASRPCTSATSPNQHPVGLNSQDQTQRSFPLPTSPRSPNAYEAEPSKTKGKGKA